MSAIHKTTQDSSGTLAKKNHCLQPPAKRPSTCSTRRKTKKTTAGFLPLTREICCALCDITKGQFPQIAVSAERRQGSKEGGKEGRRQGGKEGRGASEKSQVWRTLLRSLQLDSAASGTPSRLTAVHVCVCVCVRVRPCKYPPLKCCDGCA